MVWTNFVTFLTDRLQCRSVFKSLQHQHLPQAFTSSKIQENTFFPVLMETSSRQIHLDTKSYVILHETSVTLQPGPAFQVPKLSFSPLYSSRNILSCRSWAHSLSLHPWNPLVTYTRQPHTLSRTSHTAEWHWFHAFLNSLQTAPGVPFLRYPRWPYNCHHFADIEDPCP